MNTPSILLIALIGLCSGLFADAHPTDIAGPEELWGKLANARTIAFTGKLPEKMTADLASLKAGDNSSVRWITLASLPSTFHRDSDIKKISAFFSAANLKEDRQQTELFKQDVRMSCTIVVDVVINAKFRFSILGNDLFVFGKGMCFRAHRFDNHEDSDFTIDLASLLGKLQNFKVISTSAASGD